MEAWDAKASGLPVVPYTSGTERRGPQPTATVNVHVFPSGVILTRIDADLDFSLAPLVLKRERPRYQRQDAPDVP